jgi:hypothetical protein
VLFAFRGIRAFQALLAGVALGAGVGAVFALKAFADDDLLPMLFVAILLGVTFLWSFATAIRAPTSFVAVSPERTRIRFAGFVDTVIDNRDILGVRLTRRRPWAGVGVRTNLRGEVALVTAWGAVAELSLRRPVRVWLIPNLVPLRAERLVVSVRHPEKLAERFGARTSLAPSPPSSPARKIRTRGSRSRPASRPGKHD